MITENLTRHMHEEPLYRVVTVFNGQSKLQRWDVSKELILPEPLNFVLKVKSGKVYWCNRIPGEAIDESGMELLGELQNRSEFNLAQFQCSVVIEKINAMHSVVEAREPTDVSSCLYYLAVQGMGSTRSDVEKFTRSFSLVRDNMTFATVKAKGSGIDLVCRSAGLKVVLNPAKSETLEVGKTYHFRNAQLNTLSITLGNEWWKFKPITSSFALLEQAYVSDEGESKLLSYMAMIVGGFLLISLGNFVYKSWTGAPGNNQEVLNNPVAIQTAPEDLKLPEKFVQERKARDAEIEKKNAKQVALVDAPENAPQGAKQAILGDGKLPPGGEKNGPMAPAAAKGNGVPPAENGGALGTMKGKLSDAAALPKTHKVHVGKGMPKDALITKQKIMPMAMTDKAGASTKILALDQDQAKKILERKSESLKAAFGSVLGYLNESQAPDPLAITDPNAKGDQKLPKKGGLLVAVNGTGSGKTNDDQVRVLGQVGSAAGKGIAGGTGGSPNGVAGGYGLSTRFKGTGTSEGTGIGGSKTGNLFVDFDALNSTGEFAGSISEGLTKSEVGKVIHEHSAEIRQCYESSLVKTPGIKGRMIVDFSINPAGSVNKAAVKEAAFDSTYLGGCLMSRMKTWAFPKPRNGVFVQVTYPFSFRTLGGAQ